MRESMKQTKLSSTARIGIVNRGEAAIRFIRSVRECNHSGAYQLSTVAFYLEVDADAPYVKEADMSFPLEEISQTTTGSPYLNREIMMFALLQSDCDAVWVGWGFVAEDHIFAKMVEKNNLIFLGPSSEAMSELGDKIRAKKLAERAGVPILPWSKGPVRSIKEAEELAQKIGYPVVVKAANAGGGKGIRFVTTPEQLSAQYQSAKEETIRITGNDVVFIEHLVVTGRHLEVQILADWHGNIATFGVRDCSLQRRNQRLLKRLHHQIYQ